MGIARRLGAGCLWVLFTSAAHGTSAQQSAAELDAEARRAFLDKDYARAADRARRVYDLRRAEVPRDEQVTATAAFNVGRASLRAGRSADAVRYIDLACNGLAALPAPPQRSVGGCLLELVEALTSDKQIARAKEVAPRALQTIETTYPADGYAAAVFHAAEIFRSAEDGEAALTYFQQAAALYGPSLLNHPEFLATALTESAQLLHSMRRFAEAAHALERVVPPPVDDDRLTGAIASKIYLLADCYREMGDYDKALARLDTVARSLRRVDAEGHASSRELMLDIADLQMRNGGNVEALTTLQGILNSAPADGSVAELGILARAHAFAARAHAELQDYENAENSFRASLQQARTMGDDAFLAESLRQLGFFLIRRGRYAESRNAYEEALLIREKVHGRQSLAVAELLEQASLGLINQNECAAARPKINRARAIYARLAPKSTEMVRVLSIASRCATTKAGRLALVAQSLQLMRALDGESLGWLVESSSYHEEAGELARAERLVERALKVDPANVPAGELLARIWEARGRHADAALMLEQQVSAVGANYGEDSPNVAARRFNAGRAWLRAGDPDAARKSFLLAAGHFSRLTDRLFSMLSLAEQQQLLSQQTAVQVSGVLSVCQDDPCLAEGYSILAPWKGVVIEGLRRQNELVRSERGRNREPAVARLRQVRAQLALWASSRDARPPEEWRPRYNALVAQKEELERTVLAADGTSTSIRLGLKTLQNVLRESEALVDIYKFDQFGRTTASQLTYAAVITRRTGAPRYVRLGSAKALEAVVAQWLSSVSADRADVGWTGVKKAVWQPILDALPSDVHTVRVSGEGDLVRVPWHTFTQHQPARSLDVVEVSSARWLVHARTRNQTLEAPDRMLIVGGVDYDAGRTARTLGYPNMPFPFLKWTAEESRMIEGLARIAGIDSLWLKEGGATRAAVLQQIKGAAYLHFATHGYVPEEGGVSPSTSRDAGGAARTPLVDSGIALSGANVTDLDRLLNVGLLTAEEILDSDMSKAKLVVLSACKTSLGVKASGQGLLGLRSSLHAAGAHTIVSSLWSVDDEATQILMTSFYRKLWIDKKPLLTAFHEAQDAVRRTERFRAPRYWAGWSIINPD